MVPSRRRRARPAGRSIAPVRREPGRQCAASRPDVTPHPAAGPSSADARAVRATTPLSGPLCANAAANRSPSPAAASTTAARAQARAQPPRRRPRGRAARARRRRRATRRSSAKRMPIVCTERQRSNSSAWPAGSAPGRGCARPAPARAPVAGDEQRQAAGQRRGARARRGGRSSVTPRPRQRRAAHACQLVDVRRAQPDRRRRSRRAASARARAAAQAWQASSCASSIQASGRCGPA